jgi:hypothetical protein
MPLSIPNRDFVNNKDALLQAGVEILLPSLKIIKSPPKEPSDPQMS